MRIFVAGGTGVLGRLIVPQLVAAGHDVTVLARKPERAASLGARVVLGDVFDTEAVDAAVAGAHPEVVMQQLTDLSSGSSAANAAIRRQGTVNLVTAAPEARFVVQSIAWIYPPGDEPATEEAGFDGGADDPGRRETVASVQQMESTPVEAVVLRNGLLYGPGTWYAPDGATAALARLGQLPAEPDVSSFVHVADAAAAAVAALDWPEGAYNIVDDDPAPATAWAPVFAEAVGASAPPAPTRARLPWARGASNAKARAQGWTPAYPTWRTGFATA